MRTTLIALVPFGAVLGALFAVSCAVPESSGQCADDTDCTVRGTVCETVTNECVPVDNDYSDTAPNGVPAAVTDGMGNEFVAVPFFRGRFCTVPGGEVKAGATLPLVIEPCLHPCMDPAGANHNFTYFHQFTCGGGLCNGFTSFFLKVDPDAAASCPAEAWAQFPKEQCEYPVTAEAPVGPITEQGNALEGLLSQEVPFLTLDDMATIASWTPAASSADCQATCAGKSDLDGCLRGCQVRELAFQYTQQDERVIEFSLSNAFPAPPQMCSDPDSGCECYEVGF